MKDKITGLFRHLSLVSRIRLSYIIPFVPVLVLFGFLYYNLWLSHHNYSDMINSVVKASAFNMNFKNDFDYETYLLIAGQKDATQESPDDMIRDARDVVNELGTFTDTQENRERLAAIGVYLDNLETYIARIRENSDRSENYDENMQIWENDVQVGTSLLQEAVYQYIFYEARALDQEKDHQQRFFVRVLTISIIAFVVIAALILVVSYYLNHLLRQVRREQVRLRKAEFLVLQSQINPHFLYNTLDAITWLAESGEQAQVVKMVDSLSGFFRASLNQGKDIVRLSEELQHIRSYLEIQKIRYQDILEYRIDVPEEFGDVLIPKITIQPLVENALYHGIKNKRGGGCITVTAYREQDDLLISVEDDGVGMDEERLNQVHEAITSQAPDKRGVYGLYNVNERIRLHFGNKYGISVESLLGIKTVSLIRLPIESEPQK